MSSRNFLEIQALQSQGTVRGFWQLAPGRALSLQPRQSGLLRVAQGQAWVTLDAKQVGAGNELGDYFLHAGERLTVYPGQHVVLEAVESAEHAPVYFEWEPVSAVAGAPGATSASVLTQPLRDLAVALGMVGSALLHLGAGVVAYGRQSMLGRPTMQARHCS